MRFNPNTKPPCNYFGGKYGTIADHIIQFLPEHYYYAELFGGMAGVLFKKKKSPVEIYNDLDSRIFSLFKVLQSKKLYKEFIEKLNLTPYSREVYNEAHFILRNDQNLTLVDTAYFTFIALSLAIQPSLRHNGFRHGGGKYETSVARSFRNKVKSLDLTIERLKEVIIENIPAHKLMMKYNASNVLLYLDPPYLHSTRTSKKDYGKEMDDFDHEVILNLCKTSKSKIIISGYNNDLYNTYLKDWYRVDINTISSISASNNSENSALRTEVLWMNYTPVNQTKLNLK